MRTKYPARPEIIKKSYGLALCRYNLETSSYEVLMIKKRYTYYFVEFVLGHYNKNNEERLVYLFGNMSHEEKVTILSLDFGKLWYKIWLIDPESLYGVHNKNLSMDEQNRYNNCKKHYESSFLLDNGEKLRKLIDKSTSVDTIWEIPKGRRMSGETLIDCAMREVREETGIDSNQYSILFDIDSRNYQISDGCVTYENHYYIALWDGGGSGGGFGGSADQKSKFVIDPHLGNEFWRVRRFGGAAVKLNFHNEHQIAEVVAVRWVTTALVAVLAPEYTTFVKNLFKILRKRKIGGLTKLRGF
jgi:8-oxo-dGTP pyrophosphatase MutT (NUDIX family)